MTKLGYAILAVVFIALAIYVFRPEHDGNDEIALISSPAPASFLAVADGLEQQVAGRVVRSKNLELPLSAERVSSLWSLLTSIALPPDQVLDDVDSALLAAYGIDGKSRIEADGILLQWGRRDGKGYIWDGERRRIFAIDEAIVTRLRSLAARLDEGKLLVADGDLFAMRVDDLVIERKGVEFLAPAQPQRPDFLRRVQSLMALIGSLHLDNLDGQLPADAHAHGAIRLTFTDRTLEENVHDVTLYERGDDGFVVVDQFPAQILSRLDHAQLADLIDAFREDYLFHVDQSLRGNPVDDVIVSKGGKEWFRLERRGKQDTIEGATQWDLLYEGGRQNAAPEAIYRLVDAFNDVAVRDVRGLTMVDGMPPDAISVTLIGMIENGTTTLTLLGDQARSPTHQGTITNLAPILTAISPDAFLDLRLVNRQSTRIVKIQRRWRAETPERAEVFTLGDNGSWRQTYPASAAVDDPAVFRLATAIVAGRALSARLPTAEDRALIAKPDLEIDIRLAAKPAGHANDLISIDETMALDVGWAFKRSGEHWRAVDKDGGVSYELDAELMEAISAPVEDRHMLPIFPGMVVRIDITREAEKYSLSRTEAGWTVKTSDGESQVADSDAVRRFMRRLVDLRADRIDVIGGALTSEETAGRIECVLPAVAERTQRMNLQISRPKDGVVALFADSNRPGSVPKGRGFVTAAASETLLPRMAEFIVPRQDRR